MRHFVSEVNAFINVKKEFYACLYGVWYNQGSGG